MSEFNHIEDYGGLIDAVDATICPHLDCQCTLVYPDDWIDTAVEGLVKVVLRCPNCESTRSGYMNDEQADAMSDLMRIGEEVLQDDYKALVNARQADTLRESLEE